MMRKQYRRRFMSVHEFLKVFHIDCLSQIKHVITQLKVTKLLSQPTQFFPFILSTLLS